MEQLKTITLQPNIVTCGYNLFQGGPFVDLGEQTLPPDCVILRIRAFSVNYADCCIRWGLYESAKEYVGYPICPGFDVAGVIERVGSKVTQFAPGDAVYGCSLFGAYSTRVLIPQLYLRKIPQSALSSKHIATTPSTTNSEVDRPPQLPQSSKDMMMDIFTRAAAIPAVALTALYALFMAGHFPTPTKFLNKAILIHSAAGGVGSMLVQMATLLGLHPIVGVVGRSDKVAAAQALGCTHVIDKSQYSSRNPQKMWQDIAAISPSGYATIMESNGVATINESYDHLAMTGRMIVFGFHTNLPLGRDMLSPTEWIKMAGKMGRMPKFDAMEMGAQNKAVLAFNLSFFAQEREMLSDLFDQVQTWLQDGQLVCPRVTTFPMEDIALAHEFIQSGKSVGKIVMTTQKR